MPKKKDYLDKAENKLKYLKSQMSKQKRQQDKFWLIAQMICPYSSSGETCGKLILNHKCPAGDYKNCNIQGS